MKAYVRWMRCRNYQVEHGLISADRKVMDPDELLAASKTDIVKTLCLFIMEVKDSGGNDYNRDTLYDLIIMVQCFFKENRCPYKFFEDTEFFDLKNTLDNRMKQLSKEGKIAPRVKAVPISVQEEEILWASGHLGDDTPVKLVDTLLYLLGVHFALRAADEHKSLKVNDQLKVLYDSEVGLKYLYYEENTSKCNQGGISSRTYEPKQGRAYENVVNSDRCVVRIFEKYLSLRPSHLPKCSTDLYLRPLSVPNGSIWYSCQPRGRHALEKVIKKLCDKGGFGGKRTNHSCRASTTTRMYDQGCDEQLICEKTGHRSVAVRSYKRTSNRQLKEVTDILYGNNPNEGPSKPKIPKVKATSTVSKCPQEEKSEACDGDQKNEVEEEGAKNIQLAKGVTLNININVNK